MLHILIGERTSAIEQRLVERMGYLNPVDMVIKSNIQPYPHLNTRLHNKTLLLEPEQAFVWASWKRTLICWLKLKWYAVESSITKHNSI